MQTPTLPATPAQILAPHAAHEQLNPPIPRAARVPVVVIPFPAELALQYTRDTYVLHESDESAIVEAAAIRYGKQPVGEQDGEFQWLVDAEVERLFAEGGSDEPSGRCDWMGVAR